MQLGQTKITDPGLMRLAGLKSLKSLKRLRLTRSPQVKSQTWTDAAIEHLEKARPDLAIDVN